MSRADVPDFDLALRGYHRKQVEDCVLDLAARLEQALSQLDVVEVLQAQLRDAQLEIEQLRRALETRGTEDPLWADRLAAIMEEAERLRGEAADPRRSRRTRLG